MSVKYLGKRLSNRSGSQRKVKQAVEALESRTLFTGTFTSLTNLAPAGIGTMYLLSDGTVMAQGGGVTNAWYKLTPNSAGSYQGGTWSSLASMSLQRLYTAGNVLKDGRVFILGGEYSGPSGTANWINSGEIYNPATNAWTSIPNFPQTQFGDDPSILLPDGRVLCGYLSGPATYAYNPTTNTWAATGTKLNSDRSDEETWIKLADDSILSYDIFFSQHAQRYVPSTNTWVQAGTTPAALETPAGKELGPAFLLPDGRALQIGGLAANAIYNNATTTWTAAPSTPPAGATVIGGNDAPGAMLTNGKVLYAASDVSTSFNAGVSLFEYDYSTNTLTTLPKTTPTMPTALANSLASVPAYVTRMLDLPNGQVLFTVSGNQLYVYTPDGAPQASWAPTISNIVNNGDNTFTLSGTQLNGISEGASYGDDAEMSSNYPIVRLTDASGVVKYAKTYNWSSTGVQTGNTPVNTQVSLPSGTSPSAYLVAAVANGIASTQVLNIQIGTLTTNSITLQVQPGNPANIQVLAGASVLGNFALTSFGSVIISGNNAGDTITLSPALAGKTIVVNGGTGADNVILQSNSLLSTLTLKLGTGADTVTFSTDTFNVSTNLNTAGTSISVAAISSAVVNFLTAETLVSLNPSSGTQVNISGAATTSGASSFAGGVKVNAGGSLMASGAVTNTGALQVSGGTAMFSGGLSQTAGSTTFNSGSISASGPLAISGGSFVGNANVNGLGLTLSGTATATFNTTQTLGAVTLNGASVATITTTHSTVLDFSSLSIATTAKLDMGDGAAVVRSGNLATLSARAALGLNAAGTLWTGNGITSSLAAAEPAIKHGVGVIPNTFGGSPIYATFHGLTVASADVLIAYTFFGDADLSGVVDDTDFFLTNDGLLGHKTGWLSGDFDYTNVVDDTDFFLLNTGFLGQ